VLRYQAGIQVGSPEELAPVCRELLADADRRRLLGQNALKMMQENGGSTVRHMEMVGRYLDRDVPQ
jgi:3-deoxy-D-manno-octulosonic-acid transferase